MNKLFKPLVPILGLALMLCTPSYVAGQTNPFEDGQTISTPQESDSPFSVSSVTEMAIDGSWVNVRSGPGTGNSVIKTLPNGTKGIKLQESYGWTQIDFGNGVVGWVYNKLLKNLGSTENVADNSANQPSAPTSVALENEKQFDRWERHLGDDLFDYSKFPFWYYLKRANKAYLKGDYEKALKYARKSSGNPFESYFLQAKCLNKLGKADEAAKILSSMEKYLEDMVFQKKIDEIAAPYIDEPIVFKFGGFDDIETYKKKKAEGNRLGLNSGEYYEKYVDINTWKWRSKTAYNEFQGIAGIDCSGFVQMVQKNAFKEAGVKYPITSGRTSTSGLWSEKYTKAINPGYKPPPPPDIRPGDMILLDYGHNRYGHSMIYKGIDKHGNIKVIQMGDTAQESILPPEKYQYYKGAYRMDGMDEVRKALTA